MSLSTDMDWPNHAELVAGVQQWMSPDETLTAWNFDTRGPLPGRSCRSRLCRSSCRAPPVRPKRPGSPPASKAKSKAKAARIPNAEIATQLAPLLNIVPQLSQRLEAMEKRGTSDESGTRASRREPAESRIASEHGRSQNDLAYADGRRGRGREAVVCGCTRPHTASCQPSVRPSPRGHHGELRRALAGRYGSSAGNDSACSASTVRGAVARDRLQQFLEQRPERSRPCKSFQSHRTTPAPRRYTGVFGKVRHFRRQARGIQSCLGCG